MRKLLITLILLPTMMAAGNIDVTNIRLAGPYPVAKPFMTDTLDTEGNRIDLDEVYLESLTPTLSEREKELLTPAPFVLSSGEGQGESLYRAAFTFQNTGFAKGKVNVRCESKHKLYIDGNEQGPDFELVPGRHEVSIKLLRKGDKPDTLRVSVESEQPVEVNPEGKRYWTNADMMHGERISAVELSSSARYARIRKSITYKGGETGSKEIFVDLTTGKEFSLDGFQYWLPKGDGYVRCYRETEGTWYYETVDMKTGEKTPI